MSKIKVAVFDLDKGYRERFADYLMSYKATEIEMAVFSSQSFLLEALKEEKFQLLVLGTGYEEIIAQVKAYRVPVLILTKDTHGYVQEEIVLDDDQIWYTGKYQSMDVITKKMWMMAESKWSVEKTVICDSHIEVVGVFSPIGHELQMLFSLLYAKNRARERRVLYVNLMEFSGFSEIFERTEMDLGDVILSLREKEISKEWLLQCIYENEGFSFISPLANPESIREVTADDVRDLLYAVKKYTEFETIVLDISMNVNCLTEVLCGCSKLYCVEKAGFLFEARNQQFLDYVSKVMEGTFFERVRRIVPPCQTRIVCGGSNLLERLDWDELGDFVRGQL